MKALFLYLLLLDLLHDIVDPFHQVFDHSLWTDFHLQTCWDGVWFYTGDRIVGDLLDLGLLFWCPLEREYQRQVLSPAQISNLLCVCVMKRMKREDEGKWFEGRQGRLGITDEKRASGRAGAWD